MKRAVIPRRSSRTVLAALVLTVLPAVFRLAAFLAVAACASSPPHWKERCLALEGQLVTLEEAASELPARRAECLLALQPESDAYRVTGAWSGARSGVNVPDEDSGLLEGAVTLHNHPAMTPELSVGDLMMGIKHTAPAVCITWRTGLGAPLSRTHVECAPQNDLIPTLNARGFGLEEVARR